jgi:hypothetical protein
VIWPSATRIHVCEYGSAGEMQTLSMSVDDTDGKAVLLPEKTSPPVSSLEVHVSYDLSLSV